MKKTIIPQIRAITGATPQETALNFNAAMQELAGLSPTYERDGSTFWIFYSVETVEPETIVEEHEMKGEKAHCEDCPYCMRDLNRMGNIDLRKKWATCCRTGERTHIESTACEIYYGLSERRRF